MFACVRARGVIDLHGCIVLTVLTTNIAHCIGVSSFIVPHVSFSTLGDVPLSLSRCGVRDNVFDGVASAPDHCDGA